ncbi:MAG: ABC transporter ATP-binding protein, partial [Rhizobiaceae bacterium]|nr:ABC transporter ATP-binding protein [Rhizobiaceae bacterium]
SVLDNVLLGRVSTNVAEGSERVDEAIKALLEEMGLTDDIFHIGLDFNIGTGGKRLSEIQRQKLHLARALLKKPDFLIVNRALNSLDSRSQRSIIETFLERAKNTHGHPCGVIWVPINPKMSMLFDRVLLFSDGELVADGPPEEMSKSETRYQELLNV